MTTAIELRPASGDETVAWQGMWEQRQRTTLTGQGFVEGDADDRLKVVQRQFQEAAEWLLSRVYADNEPVGYVAAMVNGEGSARYGVVVDVWIEPASRLAGYGRAALAAVEEWLREQGADRALVTLDPEDRAQAGMVKHGTVNSQRMELRLSSPPPLAKPLSWRPMTATEYSDWLASEMTSFAQQTAASGTLSDQAARERSEKVLAELLPAGLATPDNSVTVLLDGDDSPVATLWLLHHFRHERSFVYSVAVLEEHRGKGYGRAIMQVGERLTLDAGDRVLGLNVFGHNTVAIGLYDSLGYQVIEQSRTIML